MALGSWQHLYFNFYFTCFICCYIDCFGTEIFMTKIKAIKLFIIILRPICTSGPLWPSGAFKSVTLILIGISLYLIYYRYHGRNIPVNKTGRRRKHCCSAVQSEHALDLSVMISVRAKTMARTVQHSRIQQERT